MNYLPYTSASGRAQVVSYLRDKFPEISSRALRAVMTWGPQTLDIAWEEANHLEIPIGWEMDVLGRAIVNRATLPRPCRRAVISIVSGAYVEMQKVSFDMLFKFGELSKETRVILFAVDDAYPMMQEWAPVKEGKIHLIECKSVAKVNAYLKGLTYSLSRFVRSWATLAMESDTFAVGSLEEAFTLIESGPHNIIWGTRADYGGTFEACLNIQGAPRNSMEWLNGEPFDARAVYPFNGGIIGARYTGWERLYEEFVRLGARGKAFLEGTPKSAFSDEILYNLAAWRVGSALLPDRFNVQFYTPDWEQVAKKINDPAILHFITSGRANILSVLPTLNNRSDLRRLGFSTKP